MFAAGTGIAPFRGFWQVLAARLKSHAVLYLSVQREAKMLLRTELKQLQREGKLTVRIALTRQDNDMVFDRDVGRFAIKPGKRKRIDELMASGSNAPLELYTMLLPVDRGGLEGSLYICGQAGFTKTVMGALKTLAQRFHDLGTPRDPSPETVLNRLPDG